MKYNFFLANDVFPRLIDFAPLGRPRGAEVEGSPEASVWSTEVSGGDSTGAEASGAEPSNGTSSRFVADILFCVIALKEKNIQ